MVASLTPKKSVNSKINAPGIANTHVLRGCDRIYAGTERSSRSKRSAYNFSPQPSRSTRHGGPESDDMRSYFPVRRHYRVGHHQDRLVKSWRISSSTLAVGT